MDCKRTFWRYRENKFINAKGEIVTTTRISKLKRMSCRGGCRQDTPYACDSEFVCEFLSEYLSGADEIPEMPKSVKDGDILKLCYSCGIDGDDLEMWFELAPTTEE